MMMMVMIRKRKKLKGHCQTYMVVCILVMGDLKVPQANEGDHLNQGKKHWKHFLCVKKAKKKPTANTKGVTKHQMTPKNLFGALPNINLAS